MLVLIAPMRGRNSTSTKTWTFSSRVLIAPMRGRNPSVSASPPPSRRSVLIAPMRGRNSAVASVRSRSFTSPHRPYEGSQQDGTYGPHTQLSGPHRPYEGSQQDLARGGVDSAAVCPHRPYEGSQRLRYGNERKHGKASSSPL